MLPTFRRSPSSYIVYIQEAHASDVWQMESNVKQHIAISSPHSAEERAAVAGSCVRNLHIAIPALLDDFRNTTEQAYTGWPDRLYAIDREGRGVQKRPRPLRVSSEGIGNGVGAIG